MRRLLAAAAGAAVLLGAAAQPAAAQGTAAPLGIPCVPGSGGVRVCEGTMATRVPSWDGVPLDASVSLPPAGVRAPYPLVVGLHGFGVTKLRAFDTSNDEATRLARQGYAVLTYSARGQGFSCGVPVSRTPPGCDRGWVHLADARHEGRDTQHLAGLLVDQGLVQPRRIGVTGSSYGGGQSLMLATLRDKVMLPDGRLVPWRSPKGTPMRIAAAAPRIGWSDLAYALVPSGRTLDSRAKNPYDGPIGVVKQSYLEGLYAVGLSGYYAPPGADPDADIVNWKQRLDAGEPYDGPLIAHIRRQFRRFRSAYYLQDELQGAGGGPPAPLVIYNGWTDDIMPASEAVRFWKLVRTRFPRAPFGLAFEAAFAHPRGSLTQAPGLANQARDALFARYLKGDAGARPLDGVITTTQGCNGAPVRGPFRTSSWAAQHPGTVSLRSAPPQTFGSQGGDAQTALRTDPFASGACPTVPARRDPGAATYDLPPAPGGGYTLVGSPAVRALVRLQGAFPQIAARLWDVAPGGQQTLVTRTVYRPEGSGRQVFQLHPTGWRFQGGHVPRFELLGRDSPYARPSNGSFSVTVSDATLELPVREGGSSARAGCLARRARVGARGIGRVRLGRTRARLLRLPVKPRRRTARTYRYCAKRSRGRVVAVFSRRGRRGRVRLVTTTAPGHRSGRIRPGIRTRLRSGLRRRGRRVFGVRRGRVRFVAVADRRLIRNRRALRGYLRRAGLR